MTEVCEFSIVQATPFCNKHYKSCLFSSDKFCSNVTCLCHVILSVWIIVNNNFFLNLKQPFNQNFYYAWLFHSKMSIWWIANAEIPTFFRTVNKLLQPPVLTCPNTAKQREEFLHYLNKTDQIFCSFPSTSHSFLSSDVLTLLTKLSFCYWVH